MQQASFPDLNESANVQRIAPPCKNPRAAGLPEFPGAVEAKSVPV